MRIKMSGIRKQGRQLLGELLKVGDYGLTTEEAREDLGILNPRARIADLRANGANILDRPLNDGTGAKIFMLAV